MAELPTSTRAERTMRRMPRTGDFYTNGRELYEVLMLADGRVMMENCRTEFSTEFDYTTVRRMRLVRAGRVSDGTA